MHTYLIDLLECPSCHGSLTWNISSQKDDRIIEAIARCQICASEYPVREGIGIFLMPDFPRTGFYGNRAGNSSQDCSPSILRSKLD